MPSSSTPVQIPVPVQGIRPDLLSSEVPPDALVDSINWVRRRGQFRVRPGFGMVANPVAQRPTGLVQYAYHDGSNRLVMATVNGWWRYDAATGLWVDITGTALTGSATNHQVFRTFSKAGATWLLGVNGKDAPMKWNGATATYVAMGGSPPIARAMMVVADRVILGNLSSGGTVSPVAYDVSNLSDFDTGWGTVLVGLRADSPGAIVAMRELGALQGAIYKEDSIDMAIAQDGPVPYRFEVRAPRIRGPVSSLAVSALSDSIHVYLGNDGAVYTFDGTVPQSLGLHIQRAIGDSWDVSRAGRSWVAFDAEEQTLYVMYVARGQLEPQWGVAITWPGANCYPIRFNALSFSAGLKVYVPAAITIGELVGLVGEQTATIGEYDSSTARFLLAGTDGETFVDNALLDGGAAIPALFQPGLTSLGMRGQWKTIQEIDHRFLPTSNKQLVQVQAGVSEYGEEIQWDASLDISGGGGWFGLPWLIFPLAQDDDANTFDLQTRGPYVSGHRLTGRDLAMRILCNAELEVVWDGAEGTVAPRGRK